jgi:ABC-type uncharacterized transport system permease subunit
MQRLTQVPSSFVTVLNGMVVVFVVSAAIWKELRERKRRMAAVSESPRPLDETPPTQENAQES